MLKPIAEHSPGQASRTITLDVGPKPLAELLSLAAAASRAKTRVSFTGVETRPLEDLVRLAAAGGDCVAFAGARHPADPDRADDARRASRPRWKLFTRTG
ncbi:MAG: hypothetical protein JWR08_487 [Enterovirga sp.]|nr:hypothetical protein [Enterovirga sp.]